MIENQITIRGNSVKLDIVAEVVSIPEMQKLQRVLAEASAHIAERIEAFECEAEGHEPKSGRSFFSGFFGGKAKIL